MSNKNKQKISLQRRSFCASGLGLAALGPLSLAGCGGDANPEALAKSAPRQLADTVVAATRIFLHPGLLHTEADFARMRTKVAANAQPWLSGWEKLLASGRSQLGTAPRPLETVIRGGDGQNFAQLYIDVARTYQLALRWKVSGDTRFADQAVVFLNAWSSTMKTLTGNADRFLAAGIYGYQFANAAEIMRTYSGWAPADLARFQKLMLDVFYPLSHHFLVNHNGAHITNYWANWDQCNLAAVLAIGVLCDRADLYDEAINYYKTGPGNGSSSQAVYYIHPGYLGQWQESGRDQGHTTLGVGLAGAFCEMAWNQGDDMYGLDNNRFLAGAEYVAKSNLKDTSGAFYSVPFTPYMSIIADHTGVSPGAQGHIRPVWELVRHHYANRKGLATPFCALQAARPELQPEGDGGNGDQLGFGTLTFTRDPIAAGRAPSGLSANWSGGRMVLSWWGAAHAISYNVKRATVAGGPYTVIARGITDLLTYADSGVTSGIYYYVVTAQSAIGESGASNEVRAIAGTRLHTWLAFNETTGTAAADSSGNGHAGALVNGPTRVAGRSGNAVALDGVDDYVNMQNNVAAELADFTVAAWVYWDATRTWARVFDFGEGARHYMMLTPRASTVRFAITTNHGIGEQVINGTSALPTGQWVHVAVTLSGSTGSLYVNGSLVGSNAAMHHAPFRLGSTNQNWIGRSQYGSDPYFNGKIDDFRIYSGALSATQILALRNG